MSAGVSGMVLAVIVFGLARIQLDHATDEIDLFPFEAQHFRAPQAGIREGRDRLHVVGKARKQFGEILRLNEASARSTFL